MRGDVRDEEVSLGVGVAEGGVFVRGFRGRNEEREGGRERDHYLGGNLIYF